MNSFLVNYKKKWGDPLIVVLVLPNENLYSAYKAECYKLGLIC